MKAIRLFIFIFILSTSFSCHKELFPETVVENSPIFSFSANINNVPISIKAGLDEYYMYSSFLQDGNNVYNFIGNLKQINCVECPSSISIAISDIAASEPDGVSFADSALTLGNYNYETGEATSISYNVNFQSAPNPFPTNYSWDFGDGLTSNEQNPSHTYISAGEYNVCLSIDDNTGCTSSICNLQKIGLSDTLCNTKISYSNGLLDSINFFQNTSGVPPFNYIWNFGDGAASSEPNPSHLYPDSSSYLVELIAVDANSDTAFAYSNVVPYTESQLCGANYNVVSITPIINNLSFSKITIQWIDEAGLVYTSNNLLQSITSNFQILSIEDYQNNEINQKTKKLHIVFSCNVYSGSNTIQINNGDAIIAVAYK